MKLKLLKSKLHRATVTDACLDYEGSISIDRNLMERADILIKSIHDYEEIILIGSGKGVTSVSNINDLRWKRRSTNCFTKLDKIYNFLV